MCRSVDENNEIHPDNYKSDVRNSISVAVTEIWDLVKAITHC